MTSSKPILLVSGLIHQERVAELAAMHLDLWLAAQPPVEAEIADLTALIDADTTTRAIDQLGIGSRVLVRDHQLGHDAVVDALARRQLRAIVLYPHISYEMDPSWVTDALSTLADRATVELFVLDLFCGVEESLAGLLQASDDEFGPADLRDVCARFPCLLTADVRADNLPALMSFGARGVMLASDELVPRAPAERHVMPYTAIRDLARCREVGTSGA